MASLVKHRHGKRMTVKTLAEGFVGAGRRSRLKDGERVNTFTLTVHGGDTEPTENFSVVMSEDEAERILKRLTEWFKERKA